MPSYEYDECWHLEKWVQVCSSYLEKDILLEIRLLQDPIAVLQEKAGMFGIFQFQKRASKGNIVLLNEIMHIRRKIEKQSSIFLLLKMLGQAIIQHRCLEGCLEQGKEHSKLFGYFIMRCSDGYLYLNRYTFQFETARNHTIWVVFKLNKEIGFNTFMIKSMKNYYS